MNDQTLLQRAQSDPAFHVEHIQGVKRLETYQSQILEAIAKYDRVCIRSPHDVGKTFLMARVVLWFGSSFPQSKIITTAPTHNQVKRLLWSEIRTGWKKSKTPLGGEMLMTEWKLEEDWFAVGFTSKGDKDSGEGQGTASGFQGFHAPYILIIFDEATGIPRHIWNQVEGMLTSAHVKFVCIGNPTSRQSEFFKCFKDPAWHKIKISCFDSENLKANGIKHMADLEDEIAMVRALSDEDKEARLSSYVVVRPQLLTCKAVVAAAIKWGITHPLFVAKFLGDFPEEGENSLITLGDVEKAQLRWQERYMGRKNEEMIPYKDPHGRYVGVDCAGYGPDKIVVVMIEDNLQVKRITIPKTSENLTGAIVGEITKLFNQRYRVPVEKILIDGTGGYGMGVIDGLRENQKLKDKQTVPTLRSNILISDINFGGGFDDEEDKKHYTNQKAKMYKLLGDALKEDLHLMQDQVYLEELPNILYSLNKKGQLMIESKEDYKSRTGMGSPDDSDAIALANYGRVDNQGVGEFTRTMMESQTREDRVKPHASGLRDGDHW